MRLSGSLSALGAAVALALVGCGGGSLMPNGGGGTGGSAGRIWEEYPLVSDFEDLQRATVVQTGEPPRNGYWYAFNDGSAGCVQRPSAGAVYVGDIPPTPSPSATPAVALHADWQGCNVWGAGIGADFAVPFTSAITYSGPKVAYDVTRLTGDTFWAMAAPCSEVVLRVRFPMRANTRIQDGGLCDESIVGADRCGDEWGEQITLAANGTWKQFVVRFSDVGFAQAGWGVAVPWKPADVTGIQIQANGLGDRYDFWLDDVYLLQ
jgi:hypothetical protein